MRSIQYAVGVLFALTLIIAGRSLFSGPDAIEPKYAVGDCVVFAMGGNEFEEPKTVGRPVKILAVGTERYKTTNGFSSLFPDKEFVTELISAVDRSYVKVDCGGL